MPLAIRISSTSSVPKYRQVAGAIRQAIERRLIAREEQLPSLNELRVRHGVSRDTAEKAYRLLKQEGVIISVRGKGYYAARATAPPRQRILLVFPALNPQQEAIHQSFVGAVGSRASVDLRVYGYDVDRFVSVLEQHTEAFTDFVIAPVFRGEAAVRARDAVDRLLAGRRVTLLDRPLPGLRQPYRSVVQNREGDILSALEVLLPRLRHYARLHLLFPFDGHLDPGTVRGVQDFGRRYDIPVRVSFKGFGTIVPEAGTVYLTVRDEELATVVRGLSGSELTVGKDVGLLTYDDGPLKEVLLGGITVVSTRYGDMGRATAGMILENRWEHVESDFVLTERQSL